MINNRNLWHFCKNFFGGVIFCKEKLLFNNAFQRGNNGFGNINKNNESEKGSFEDTKEKIEVGLSKPKSDIFKSSFEASIFEWLDPSKGYKIEEFSSFTDYLREDISKHAEYGAIIGMFINNPNMPESVKGKYKEYIDSGKRSDIAEDIRKVLMTGDNAKDTALHEAFDIALKNDDKNNINSGKEILCGFFDQHSRNFENNTQHFVEQARNRINNKIEILNTRYSGSVIAGSLKGQLQGSLNKLGTFYNGIYKDLSSAKLLGGADNNKIQELYLSSLIATLSKNGVISDNERKSCFFIDGDILGTESTTKLNTNVTLQFIESIKNPDSKGIFRSGFDRKEQYEIESRLYYDSLRKYSLERYNESFKNSKDIESEIDFLLEQCDEIMVIADSGTKGEKDVENVIQALGDLSEDESRRIMRDLKKSAIQGFDASLSVINDVKDRLKLDDKDVNILSRKLQIGQQNISNDPLFWTMMWNDLLDMANCWYEKETSGEKEADTENEKKGKTNIQELREKSPDEVNSIYTSLFGSGGKDSDSKEGLINNVRQLLHSKKDFLIDEGTKKNKFGTELDTLNNNENHLLLFKARHDSLFNQYNNLNAKKDKTDTDIKYIEFLKGKIQHNAQLAYNFKKDLDDYIVNLRVVSGKTKKIVWVSLASISFKKVFESITKKMKSNADEASAVFTEALAKGLGLEQLVSEQQSRMNQEYSGRVEDWKKSLKSFSKTEVYNEIKKNIENPEKYKEEHLHAVLELLGDKGGLRINDNLFIDAINIQLKRVSPTMVIDRTEFIEKMTIQQRESYLRKIGKPLFRDADFFPKIIRTNGDKIGDKCKQAMPEINRLGGMGANARMKFIYKNYIEMGKMAIKGSDKSVFDKNGQIKSGKVLNFGGSSDIDSNMYEQALFFSMDQVITDTRHDIFFLIRAIACGLIPEERISQFEERGIYGKLGFTQAFRGKDISFIKQIDKMMTTKKDGTIDLKAINGEIDGNTEILERVGFVIRYLNDECGGRARINRNSRNPEIDQDSWRDASGKITYHNMKSNLLPEQNLGKPPLNDFSWQQVFAGLNDEFFTFGKDYKNHTLAPDKKLQENQVSDLAETMKSFMLVDAIKIAGTYKVSGSNTIKKLDTEYVSLTPREISSGTKTGEFAQVMRNIAYDTLSRIGRLDIYDGVYKAENSKEYFDNKFDDQFNMAIKTPRGRQALIDTVQEYQSKGYISSQYVKYNINKGLDEKLSSREGKKYISGFADDSSKNYTYI